MNGEDPARQPPARGGMGNRAQIDNALRALHQKKPIPEIDFTLHTMEDGRHRVRKYTQAIRDSVGNGRRKSRTAVK